MAKNGLPLVFSCTSCARGWAAFRLAVKRIRNQLVECRRPERRKHDLLHLSLRPCGSASSFASAGERGSLRCRGRRRSTAGAARPDRSTDPPADQASPRRAIANRRGTARADAPVGEHADEAPEHQLEAALRVLRRKVWNGRLFPDDELHLGDEIGDQLAIRTHRLRRASPPLAQLGFALDSGADGQELWKACARVA